MKNGIIKPAIDEAFVDYYHPEEMDLIVDEVGAKYKDLETFLASPEKDSYPEYEQYILHRVVFTPTQKFIKQYKKNEKKKSWYNEDTTGSEKIWTIKKNLVKKI